MTCTHERYQANSCKTQKPHKLTSDMPALRRYSAVFSWPLSTATSRGVSWWRQSHVHSNDEWVVCRMGKHQHQLAHQCSPCEKFAHTWSVKLNIMGIWEWGHLWLNGWDIYGLNGWESYGKVSCCFFWKYVEGLGPFELLTCGLLILGSAVQISCQYQLYLPQHHLWCQ